MGKGLDNVMGLQEAAKKWGLSPGYIKNLCNDGKLDCKKVNNSWVLELDQPNPKKN